jgi:hypothetical protein
LQHVLCFVHPYAASQRNDVIGELVTHISSVIYIRYSVFVTTRKENPVSHKYVVTKGIKIFIALSDKLG